MHVIYFQIEKKKFFGSINYTTINCFQESFWKKLLGYIKCKKKFYPFSLDGVIYKSAVLVTEMLVIVYTADRTL